MGARVGTTKLTRLRLIATVLMLTVGLLFVGATRWVPDSRMASAGVLLATLLMVPSYWGLSLTLRSSDGRFFGAFFGGMAGRLAGLGAGVAWVVVGHRGSVASFALSAVATLVVLTLVELTFIGRQNALTS